MNPRADKRKLKSIVRIALSLTLAATVLLALMPVGAGAVSGPPLGRYDCFNGSNFTLKFKLLRHHRYSVNGKTGKDKVNRSTARLKFTSGPFRGAWVGVLKGRHFYADRQEYTILLNSASGPHFQLDCRQH